MDKIKKYLPFLILLLGVVVLVSALVVFRKKAPAKEESLVESEQSVPEIPFDKRPFAMLIPSKDGHWLKLKVENIKIQASSLDYEILYQLPDGRTQGVPGTIKLDSSSFERDILLGSESSGKYRYDEGVKSGTLALKFRDEKGKLIGKLSSVFTILSDSKELVSSDQKFKYVLDEFPKGVFFVVMETFGLQTPVDFTPNLGPYGIFASVDKKFPGIVEMGNSVVYYLQDNSWMKIESGKAPNIGVFVSE